MGFNKREQHRITDVNDVELYGMCSACGRVVRLRRSGIRNGKIRLRCAEAHDTSVRMTVNRWRPGTIGAGADFSSYKGTHTPKPKHTRSQTVVGDLTAATFGGVAVTDEQDPYSIAEDEKPYDGKKGRAAEEKRAAANYMIVDRLTVDLDRDTPWPVRGPLADCYAPRPGIAPEGIPFRTAATATVAGGLRGPVLI